MIEIYKITNPIGKVYIGQTWDINKREGNYKSLNCKGQPKLYNSIKKHGWGRHNFEIIHVLSENITQEQLDKLEVHYWKQHINNNIPMLNIKDPGCGGKHSIETCIKISEKLKGRENKWLVNIYTEERNKKIGEANKGKHLSIDHKKTISNTHKNNSYNLGLKRSKDTRLKQSLAKKGIKKSYEHIQKMKMNKIGKGGKSIICINDNKIFNTLREASKFYNINPRSISNILLGLAKQTRNLLTFKYY